MPMNSIYVSQECAIEFNLCFLGLSHWIQFIFLGTISLNSIYVSGDSTIWVQLMLHGTIQLSSIYVSHDSTIEVNLCFLGLSHCIQCMFHVIAIESNLCFMTMPLNLMYVSWLCHCVQFMFKDCYAKATGNFLTITSCFFSPFNQCFHEA